MARRYSDWARQQADLADRAFNPKVRHDHLALADYYLRLAKEELAAANRLELKATLVRGPVATTGPAADGESDQADPADAA
jgi:hypothetical protein